MRSLLLVTALAANGGCAVFASANAHHNSRGTACLGSSAFGGIDLAIAGVTAAAITATEASAGYYTITGIFGLSGLLGIVSATRCRGDDTDPAGSDAPPASNTAPSFGEAPVDPEARDATHEEMFGSAPAPAPPPIRNGIPTTLPPTLPPDAPAPAPKLDPPSNPAAPTCTLAPRRDCPDGYYCRLVAENVGECEKMN